MARIGIAILGFVFVPTFILAAHPESQIRLPGEDYLDALKRYEAIHPHHRATMTSDNASATDLAKPFDQLDYSIVPEWRRISDVVDIFRRARDLRFLVSASKPDFKRRSSWLYPDDGCFARAALFDKNVEAWKFARPAKVFIFGNLKVKTANSPTGEVEWWYHVVPVVASGKNIYAMDPALDPKAPLLISDWVALMTDDVKSVTLSICSSHSYTPESPCVNPSNEEDSQAESDQVGYLDAEWSRLEELKRDPGKELGDNPPWKEVDFVNAISALRN